MNSKDDFKPYIPNEKITPELTFSSVAVGIVLAVVFGAANAYLGLRVGLTVSASIPAAVIAMGVMRIMKKSSVLESNIIQTVGSAGESLAAGAIFTLPALFLWASEGKTAKPSIPEITLIALIGGLLGVFFMVPLRNSLIVREHSVLPYPEGSACAEVLMAGEAGEQGAKTVFWGMGLSAIFKFITDGLKIASGEISLSFKSFTAGVQIYPAVMSVGYICGAKISSYMLAGGVLSWLVIIPCAVNFGQSTVIPPLTQSIGEVFSQGGSQAVWSSYVRYIGAGALAAGGIISLLKSLPLILAAFSGAVRGIGAKGSALRTQRSIGAKTVIFSIVILSLTVWLSPVIPVSLAGAVGVVIFGFFFAAVSARMVGIVGSSNNPVSGMAIACLIIISALLMLTGSHGAEGMVSAIAIGSIVCIISAISGDTSQDLKTGFLLGATPIKQQIGEIIGVCAAALSCGATLYLLDYAWGFGSQELAAPQATLMKIIVEGVMQGDLPWDLVFIGIFIALCAEILRIPVLPFAIGVYLPIHLSACIMTGGLIRLCTEKLDKNPEKSVRNGTLYCSGMIAGEGLMGIILAVFSIAGIGGFFDMSSIIPQNLPNLFSVAVFLIIILSVFKFSLRGEKNEKNKKSS